MNKSDIFKIYIPILKILKYSIKGLTIFIVNLPIILFVLWEKFWYKYYINGGF